MFIIGNTIGGGLKRYPDVWKKYFPTLINLTIGGDLVQQVLPSKQIHVQIQL